jgi:Zn-dependent metalloprotease
MHLQARLLSVAVLAGLASLAMPAFAANKADAPAALRAKDMLSSNGSSAHRAADDAFSVRDVIVDRDGAEHVRFDRTFRGLPVIGGDVVMHSRSGKFKAASVSLKTTERPGVVPKLSAEQAVLAAGADFAGTLEDIGSQGLVVYARGAKPVLAYEVRVRGVSKRDGEADMRYFIDAKSGKVLDRWNRIMTTAATGIGQTLFLGDLNMVTDSISGGFQLVDPTRGGGNTRDGLGKEISRVYNSAAVMTDADNNWGNNTESVVAF